MTFKQHCVSAAALALSATMKLLARSAISASSMLAFSNTVSGMSPKFFGSQTTTMKQNSLGIQYSRKF
jgi:hypothetical protein